MFEAMNREIAVEELRPVVDHVFGFGEIQSALRHMEAGAHFGKICLRV
jgi:NADPH:quinone reductase-like Zn-dependent oxidoreductase